MKPKSKIMIYADFGSTSFPNQLTEKPSHML